MYDWTTQFADPIQLVKGIYALSWYFADWHRYSRLPTAEPIHLVDTQPQLHSRTGQTSFDPHYFYVTGWAMRRILPNNPEFHVDVGSHHLFASLLAAVLAVVFVDYRPLKAKLHGLHCVCGNILKMPFADNTLKSLSCLHVAEHIGLGRYGDPLDPQGTKKASKELLRILAPGGNLYFAVPVGRPRLRFNGQRIHTAETICDYFSELELMEFSGVHDDGHFVERTELSEFRKSSCACGIFWFRKRMTKSCTNEDSGAT